MDGRTMPQMIRVLHAPLNYANQAHILSDALRRQGIDSRSSAYKWGKAADPFEFGADSAVPISFTNWLGDELAVLGEVLNGGYDIVHLWNRSLVYHGSGDNFFNGFDLPYLRSAGLRTVYRFTGYELRRKSRELELNPFSPFRYGFESRHREEAQKKYLDFIAPYTDALVVQDPEMQSYLPQARIIPRAVDLDRFAVGDPAANKRPLVVHAPTDRLLKGSEFILRAVETLKAKGVDFDFQLIEKMPHAEAVEWYRRADIVVDQLLIGWYGVVAIEAMAMGKTVIAYIREDLEGFFRNGMPLVRANPQTIAAVLRRTIEDADLRRAMAGVGRAFVEEVHDCRVVAASLSALYREILERPVVPVRKLDLAHQIDSAAGVVTRLAERRQFANFVRRLEIAAEIEPEPTGSGELGSLPSGFRPDSGGLETGPESGWHIGPWPAAAGADRLSQFERATLLRLQTEVIGLRYKALRYDEIRTRFPEWRSKAERYDRLVAKGWYRFVLPIVGLLLAPLGLVTAFRDDRSRRREVELLLKLSPSEVEAKLASDSRRAAAASPAQTAAPAAAARATTAVNKTRL